MDSILNSIKKMLGISEEYTNFDTDIIIHINSAFVTLAQIGVTQAKDFSITDEDDTWDDFIDDDSVINLIKPYIYTKVRVVFDPPTSSIVMDAMNRSISESEWRIQAAVDFSSNS